MKTILLLSFVAFTSVGHTAGLPLTELPLVVCNYDEYDLNDTVEEIAKANNLKKSDVEVSTPVVFGDRICVTVSKK